MGAQKDWNLKADRRKLNLKCDTHVRLQLASRGHLDSCHRDFIFHYGSHSQPAIDSTGTSVSSVK
jgi:hypothetical protein